MNFEAQLDKYAELVVRAGLNVQQGQEVLIEADLEAAPLVRLAAKHAWAAGAKSVTVMWSDEATTRLEYENAGMRCFSRRPRGAPCWKTAWPSAAALCLASPRATRTPWRA